MAGASKPDWCALFDELVKRGRDAGASHGQRRAGARHGVCRAVVSVPVQRCTVHKQSNLLAHAQRGPLRGVQAPNLDADRTVLRRNCRHAVLGARGLGTYLHPRGEWLREPLRKDVKSTELARRTTR